MSESNITYKLDIEGVDWQALQDILIEDHFHNGRSIEQYQTSFENSAVVCIAYDGDKIIGTTRALSDGVCNAYIVDVWTYSAYRKQGIAKEMMRLTLNELQGQHVYLWTDDAMRFYEKLGMERDPSIGFATVVGEWLQNKA